MDADSREILYQLVETVLQNYDILVAQYVAEKLAKALMNGGELYERIMAGAIAGAQDWYDMYSPEVYKRGYTMTKRANINISANISVSGTDISASGSVTNTSPHAVYAEGFWFYKRGKRYWRPGGDLMASVPKDLDFEVEIPSDVADELFDKALSAAL